MRILALLLLTALAALAQDARLTWRLQIELISTNNAAANSLRGQVQSVIKNQDKLDPERKGFDVEVREHDRGAAYVTGVYILKDEATATNAFAQLTPLFDDRFTGRMQLHCCPREGSIKDWGGCDADARAKTREVRR